MKRKRNQLREFHKKKQKQSTKTTNISTVFPHPASKESADLTSLEDDAYSLLLSSLKSSKQVLKDIHFADAPAAAVKDETIKAEGEDVSCSEDEDSVDTSPFNGEDDSDLELQGKSELKELDSDASTDSEDGDSIGGFKVTPSDDPFKSRFEQDLSESLMTKIESLKMVKSFSKASALGVADVYGFPGVSEELAGHVVDLNGFGDDLLKQAQIKPKLTSNWKSVNKSKVNPDGALSQLQEELGQHMFAYKDLFFCSRTFQNAEEIRRLYCLHAISHVLKTRSRVVKNNAKVAQLEKNGQKVEDGFRDQGLTRPKVLILVPFRDACLRVVNLLTKLCLTTEGKAQVMQNKRFKMEYSADSGDKESQTKYVPDDHKAMFAGNVDDCFRIGLTVLRTSVKLYARFYNADILIASPLGLRTIIGADGEKHREYDFLSSIELLIIDQADVFLMQNWEHVWHLLDHLHLTPKESHDVDFSRVRMWSVNGWAKYYRQTMVFASLQAPELNGIFNKYCYNYSGKVKIRPSSIPGHVQQVVSQIPQMYHRLNCASHTDIAEYRFKYFISKVLPDFTGSLSVSTAIFVPSYFDFVRLRNYLKKEEINFCQISEYSKRSNISRSRTLFLEKRKHFLLFTERFYFFYRYRIRGIKHLIFYELPLYPQFYSEIINFMDTATDKEKGLSAASCTVMYSQFDSFKLENVIGTERCQQILSSSKDMHMVMSGS